MNRIDKIFFATALLTALLLFLLTMYVSYTEIDFQNRNLFFKIFPTFIMVASAWMQTRTRDLSNELAKLLRCSIIAALIGVLALYIKFFIMGFN